MSSWRRVMLPSNPEGHQHGVIRHYRLMNRCSSKHVRITSGHVDAQADYSDIYGQSQSIDISSVVTMASKVNGKTGNLTPCRPETPENFITKIGHI